MKADYDLYLTQVYFSNPSNFAAVKPLTDFSPAATVTPQNCVS